jgi:VWFA-related protein
MRTFAAALAAGLLLAAVPAFTQSPGQAVPYKIVFDPDRDVSQEREGANNTLYVTVRFRVEGKQVAPAVAKQYKILIKEDERPVREVDVPQPKPVEDLSLVLAMDISGSMNKSQRIQKARAAANAFFDKLPAKAECGLILFNHTMEAEIAPGLDRKPLRNKVDTTKPSGGTAYLDATARGIDLWLRDSKNKARALVVMTDGIDLNSRAALPEVINKAQAAGVKVYTIGIGEPGKNDPVTTVLVLDKSGSMLEPADDKDQILKIDALKEAAKRFIDIMRVKARATLLEFSDQVRIPEPFSGDKARLRKEVDARIGQKTAGGETAFLDAAYTAVATLEAENPRGIKAVVVLTDGVDNSSRRRKEEVIKRAKDAGIKIHMLGLGRKGELDEKTMRAIAEGTGGEYHHAGNQKKLLDLFEDLSIQLHDEGVDEASLKELAAKTGGQYYPVKDADKLKFFLEEVSQSVLKNETIKFRSLDQTNNGTLRKITLELVRFTGGTNASGGAPRYEVVQQETGHVQVHGVVVPEMNYLIYLGILGVLGVLLALPPALRRLTRGGAGG